MSLKQQTKNEDAKETFIKELICLDQTDVWRNNIYDCQKIVCFCDINTDREISFFPFHGLENQFRGGIRKFCGSLTVALGRRHAVVYISWQD